MKRCLLWMGVWVVIGSMVLRSEAASADHWLGVGAHYWTTVDDVELDDIDDNGIGYYATYQWRPGSLLGLELDVEMLPDHFAGAEDDVFSPQAYLVLGSTIYAAAGIGYYYSDDEFSDDPFYVLRAGLNLELLPRIALDVSGDYRFTEWDDNVTDDIDTDTVTLSLAVRFGL